MFAGDASEALREAMQESDPDVVGFSIRNVENQIMLRSEFYLPEVKALIDQVREESHARIIVGGAALGVLATPIVNYLNPDAGVTGEAEESISSLLAAIAHGNLPQNIPGLITPGANAAARLSTARPVALDRLLKPDRRCLLLHQYRESGSVPNLITKRGCAFQCIFCETPPTEGRRIRAKSPAVVVAEVETLLNLGFDEFFFTDPVFNFPRGYAEAVAREILRRGLRVNWRATLHPGYISAEQLELLRSAGLSMVFLGSDHASVRMLENYAKEISPCDLATADRLLAGAAIPYFLGLLLGGPGETRSSVIEALDFAANTSAALVGIRIGIRIYPRTPLWGIALREGRIRATDDLLMPTYYLARGTEDWIVELVRERAAKRPDWAIAGMHT
jgi:radical SAM superfamily enzyme YgiQ (UPF0313 family)